MIGSVTVACSSLRLAGASHAVCSTAAAAGSLSCARRGLVLMLDAWPSAGAATSERLQPRAGTRHTLGDGTTAAGSLERRCPPVSLGQHRKSKN